jgi:hypothetical protein
MNKSVVELAAAIGLRHCRKSIGNDAAIVKAIAESKVPKKAPEQEKSLDFLGVHLTWHWALPEVKPWAGQATMNTVLYQRIEAVRKASYASEPILDWLLPLKTELGLDSRINTDPIDVGFSPQSIGMPIMCYVAAECLAIVGLELAEITRQGRKKYSIDVDGTRWTWTYEPRGTGQHRRATAAKASRRVLSGYGTVAEAAEAAGVARTTLLYAAERGELVTIDTHGGTTLVDVASAKKWAKNRPNRGRKPQD